MKLTTIKDRKTGKVSILVSPDIHPNNHGDAIKKLAVSPANDDVSEIVRWIPERVIRFVTTAEHRARTQVQAEWEADEAKAREEKLRKAKGLPAVQDRVKHDTMKATQTIHHGKFNTALAVLFIMLACAFSAQAQRYGGPITLWSWKTLVGITNGATIAPSLYGTLTGGGIIDGSKQNLVAYDYAFSMNTNKASTNYLCWLKSIDGTLWDTNNAVIHGFEKAAAPTAGDRNVFVTNLTMNGAGYWKLYWASNDATGGTAIIWPTNITLRWAPKISAP